MKQAIRKRSMDGEPWLQQNPLGYWVVNHPRAGAGGRAKIFSLKTKDEEQARALLATYVKGLSADSGGPELLTVADVLDFYLNNHVEHKAKDRERRTIALNWLRAGIGKLPLATLKKLQITEYQTKRANGTAPIYAGYASHKIGVDKRASAGTMYYEIGALIAAFRYCVDEDALSPALVPAVKRPPRPAGKDIWLTKEEADWLLHFVQREGPDGRQSRLWRFVWLSLATAARKSTVLGLTWDCVDMDQRKINYQLAEDDAGPIGNGKKKTVSVPMADWLVPMMQRAVEEDVGQPWVLDVDTELQSQFAVMIREAFEATGNKKWLKVTPHTLRHTAASLMAQAGVPLWQVAGVLGNTVAMVESTYAHHCPDRHRTAVNAWGPSVKNPEVVTLL